MPVNIDVLNSTTGFGGLCLQFTRLALGAPALYATAYKAYLGAQHKHPGDTNPPYGTAVFWAPKHPGEAGHVAPSLGGGLVRTTNSATQTVYTVAISKITTGWGMPYLGWTEDLNGVRIWTPPASAQEDDMLADERNMLWHLKAMLEDRTVAQVAEAVWTRQIEGVQAWAWLRDARLAADTPDGVVAQAATTLTDADLGRIARAVADEQARRLIT